MNLLSVAQVMPLLAVLLLFIACESSNSTDREAMSSTSSVVKTTASTRPDTLKPVRLSDTDWKERLTDKEYYVLREAGTERPFTENYWDNKEEGIYRCAGCGLPLFDSDTKFKSGTGWPSFYAPALPGHVGERKDVSMGMVRVEVICNRCEGHLGHVFNDGPKPTGLRYCINGAALDFSPDTAKKKP